jgi:hypothetical protein
MLTGQDAGPVTAAERLGSLDTLRGVAVMGILVMNIYAFAMPLAAYNNPLIMGGTDALNMGTWFFTHLFFDQKFMSIFSMLYGAGMIIGPLRCPDWPALARKPGVADKFSLRSCRVFLALADLWSKAADAALEVYTLALACLAANRIRTIKNPGERT